MNFNEPFFKSADLKYTNYDEPKKISTNTLKSLMQEKHELESTHNTFVKKCWNPYIDKSFLKPEKNPSRFSERGKKIHHIYCPTIQTHTAETKSMIEQFIPLDNPQMFSDFDPLELTLNTTPVEEVQPKTYTNIYYAEDLFSNNKNSFIIRKKQNATPKMMKFKFKSKFNNSYTRKIAGTSVNSLVMTQREYVDDPLTLAETKLPKRLRSGLSKNSPWIYSSVLRTNTICPVKCKSRANQ